MRAKPAVVNGVPRSDVKTKGDFGADDESDSGSVQSQLIERGGQVAEELGALAPDRCDFRKAPAKNLLACKLSITIRSEQF
jgi:hypothetical protein